jgi:hypothetical protein
MIATKERERAALAKEAARTVQAAEVQSRVLTPAEDARVLRVVKRVRALEEEIGHQLRHDRSGKHALGVRFENTGLEYGR